MRPHADIMTGYPFGSDGYPRAWRAGDRVELRDVPDAGRRTVLECVGAFWFNLVSAGDLRASFTTDWEV